MDAAEADAAMPTLANWSSPVRLYSGTGYSGSALALSQRGQYVSLASYGFNNVTSSYRIGACSSRFYDVYPATAQYPGSTGAWAQAASMLSGWSNRISSVYIN